MSGTATGYADPAYAASLAEFGEPRQLPSSGGSLLVRPVPRTAHRDAIGPYPLFACRNWRGLEDDLRSLGPELVSVTLVADPFGDWTEELLGRCFPDRLLAFKQHFAVDLASDPLASASRHHRRDAARGLRQVEVERVAEPLAVLDDWTALYGQLVRRHDIRGLAAFSQQSFAAQLAVSGMVAFRALRDGAVVGAALWYTQGDVAHYHLAAVDERGYQYGASYALMAAALEHFAGAGLGWAALGAGAGTRPDASDGLTAFKRGWATTTRPAYLCGRILDAERYTELSAARGGEEASFFPAYRDGHL